MHINDLPVKCCLDREREKKKGERKSEWRKDRGWCDLGVVAFWH